MSYSSQILTRLTRFAKMMSVFKHIRPIKTTLQNLSNSFPWRKMASTSFIMTKWDYTKYFIIRDTSPNDLIWTVLKWIRIIIEKIAYLNHEAFLILSTPVWWCLACDQKIDNISIPRQSRDGKQLFIREWIPNGQCIHGFIKSEARQMVCHHIFYSLFIFNGDIKFL